MDMAMAAGMLGLQQQGGMASAFALALVTYTRAPWQPPTDAELDRARAAAARFKLSDDLAVFLPPEPRALSRRARKDGYRGVVIALKHIDALEGTERTEAISEVRTLLGAGQA